MVEFKRPVPDHYDSVSLVPAGKGVTLTAKNQPKVEVVRTLPADPWWTDCRSARNKRLKGWKAETGGVLFLDHETQTFFEREQAAAKPPLKYEDIIPVKVKLAILNETTGSASYFCCTADIAEIVYRAVEGSKDIRAMYAPIGQTVQLKDWDDWWAQ